MDRETVQEVRRAILAVIVVGMVFWVLNHILGRDIPISSRDAVMLVLGVLLQRFTDIVGFDFNTSASAHRKDVIIGTQAKTINAAQAALAPLATGTDENGNKKVEVAPGDTVKVQGVEDDK